MLYRMTGSLHRVSVNGKLMKLMALSEISSKRVEPDLSVKQGELRAETGAIPLFGGYDFFF
jgi:hypothetical protein